MKIPISQPLALVIAAVLSTLYSEVFAQSHGGSAEPYYDQYEPVYMEDRILRFIKDGRAIAEPAYPSDQPEYGVGDQYYDQTDAGYYERRGDDDDDDDCDDDD